MDSHPAWGDPFVAEWKAFYENITENKSPKTGPADFVHDLRAFCRNGTADAGSMKMEWEKVE